MASDILETWRRNNVANFLMLDAIPAKAFDNQYSTHTRTVASQFAHMHNVRLYQLGRRVKTLPQGLETYGRGATPKKKDVRASLKESEKAMASFLVDCEEAGKVKSWKGGPVTFLGYLLAHEAHHRGLINVSLRLSGTKIPDEIVYGIWQSWNKA